MILEAGDAIGPAWRERWDSLVLFTPRRYDALPGLDFPGDPDGYPTRDEVLAYLEDYAARFDLPVELGARVRAVRRAGERFELELDDRTIDAGQVVVATGPFQTPRVPGLDRELAPDLYRTHSTGYRKPGDIPAGTVLIVGGGNTGFQIAKELSGAHEVHLAVGSRQMPLPQRLLGRDLFTWLERFGLMGKTVDSRLGQRLKDRDTLIGSSPRELRKRDGVAAAAARGPGVRPHGGVRGRQRARGGRGHLGDRLRPRPLLDRPAGLRRGRPASPSARGDRRARALLPRPPMAAHARLGPPRMGRGRESSSPSGCSTASSPPDAAAA